jgi:hypothetical protein
MWKEAIFILIGVAVTMLSWGSPPQPVVSTYLETVSGNFTVHRNEGIAYAMEFRATDAMPSEYYLRFSFAHPKRGVSPVSESRMVENDDGVLKVQSEILDCAKNGARLSVDVEVFSDSGFQTKLGGHHQPLKFSMPKEVLKQFGIPRC